MTVNSKPESSEGFLLEELIEWPHLSWSAEAGCSVVGESLNFTPTFRALDDAPTHDPRFAWIEGIDSVCLKDDRIRKALLEHLRFARRTDRRDQIVYAAAKVLFALIPAVLACLFSSAPNWWLGACLAITATLLCLLLRGWWLSRRARQLVATIKVTWLSGKLINRMREMILQCTMRDYIDEWGRSIALPPPSDTNTYRYSYHLVAGESVDEVVRRIVSANPALVACIGDELEAKTKMDEDVWRGLLSKFVQPLAYEIARRCKLCDAEKMRQAQRDKEDRQRREEAKRAADEAAAQAEALSAQARTTNAADAVGMTPAKLAEYGREAATRDFSSVID